MLKKFNTLDNTTQLMIVIISLLSCNKLMDMCDKLYESGNQTYVILGAIFIITLLIIQGISIFLGFKAMKKFYSELKSKMKF